MFLRAILFAVVSAFLPGACAQAQQQRPNILVILSDDMGYSDIGCYGGEIATPHLDRLAAGGLRFTQFYNTGRCCPTRASLLTGLYPHQAGVGHMMEDRGHDGYRGELNRRCRTIAEVLRPAGYATFMTGKWHVTKGTSPEGPRENWPLQRGFERFYGTITGAGSFFDPGTLTRDNTMISPFADPDYQPEQYYYTTAISDHASRFLDEHFSGTRSESPFFMYVAYTAAHWPMHALPEDIAKYKGKYDGGYAPIREARLRRLRELQLLDPSWQPAPQVGDWQAEPHPEWEARCMEVYAAMVDSMDQGIGRIVSTLERHGQLENTLILYLQDNGGCQEEIGRRGNHRRPVKPTLPEIPPDAIRTDVIPRQNRAGVATLQGPHVMPGPEDTYIAYGLRWANVSNVPFREYKHFVHEGGIATPLIAHWPRGIARRNELEHQPGHLVDLMATCVDLANAEYPQEVDGRAIQPLEGVSLRPAFAGKALDRPRPLFWEHEGNRAIRDGHWKLVAKENQPWELYDMRHDRPEANDLSAEHPELVARLSAAWQAWAERAHVLPLGTWRNKQVGERLNRQQKQFALGSQAALERADAPYVVGQAMTLHVLLEQPGQDGVLLAQGGSSSGYALYLQEGRPSFALRGSGQLYEVHADASVKTPTRLTVRWQKDGTLHILAGDQLIGEGKLPGTLSKMPVDGLQVGRDDRGAVGPYEGPFPFSGTIGRVELKLHD